MFQYKKKEFPNLLILVELVMCFSLSNSTVEETFSLPTTLSNNHQLSMQHDTMEDDCLLIAMSSLKITNLQIFSINIHHLLRKNNFLPF